MPDDLPQDGITRQLHQAVNLLIRVEEALHMLAESVAVIRDALARIEFKLSERDFPPRE